MEEIKVYLQRPWKFSDSSYYKYLLDFPPKGISYLGQTNNQEVIQKKSEMLFLNFIKKYGRKIIENFMPSRPNSHFSPKGDYDLIHCAHCLSTNKEIPWVCDTEYVGQFWIAGNPKNFNKRKKILNLLQRDNCKKILAWTDWASRSIIKNFPEIKEKVQIIYPGIPCQKLKKIKKKKITLLYVSRRFYFKGGLYALEVMDRVTKAHDNVEGIIISDTPPEVYNKYKDNKKMKFLNMVKQKKLMNEIYPISDILLYPSFTDTFGFAITEAMSFGLPVISVEGHSRREIIENGKTGFVIKSGLGDSVPMNFLMKIDREDIVRELVYATEKLVKSKSLREKMKKNSYYEISSGKFSIKKRNEDLKKVYEEATDYEKT